MSTTNGDTERSPLLGRPTAAPAPPNRPLYRNLFSGTAPLAQAGTIVLVLLVLGGIFTHKLILFSLHPILNGFGLLLATQALLILQPTSTPAQKRNGTLVHATLWATALASMYAGLIVIEVHKERSGLKHFKSWHAILGVVIYVFLLLQAWVGVTQYFFPGIYGGVENGKKLYKYHRVFGYFIILLVLINVVLATKTFYVEKVLEIKTWGTVLGSFFVIIGVGPRIRAQKVKLWNRQ